MNLEMYPFYVVVIDEICDPTLGSHTFGGGHKYAYFSPVRCHTFSLVLKPTGPMRTADTSRTPFISRICIFKVARPGVDPPPPAAVLERCALGQSLAALSALAGAPLIPAMRMTTMAMAWHLPQAAAAVMRCYIFCDP